MDSTGGTVWRENTRGKTDWQGHLRRKNDGCIGRRMLRVELPGKRKRGRPKGGSGITSVRFNVFGTVEFACE